MGDDISFFNEDDINKHLDIVLKQTNYSKEEAIVKLKLFNCDYMKVLKDYIGIVNKNEEKPKSLNQEIYKQIRTKLDLSMKEYREKNPINIDQVISNFNESEKRKENRISN